MAITPRELADKLIGTAGVGCDDDPLAQLHSAADVAEFDSYAFCCDGCGWWCDVEELNNDTDDQLCDDCNE